jgi:uncharacterized protein
MSQENIEIVRTIHEAFNRRDWDTVFLSTDPAVEFTLQRGPNAGTYRGRAAVQAVLEDAGAAFDLWTAEPEEFFAGGDHVVAYLRFHLRPKGSGAEFEIRIGMLWTIRDGKAVSAQSFPDRKQALEAAGLRE